MVPVAEASSGGVGRRCKGMLVEPEELAVVGQQLNDAEGCHADGRHGIPTQQAFDILNAFDPRHDNEEQQDEVQEHDESGERFGGCQREARPASEDGASAVAAPHRQQIGRVGRQPRQEPGRQGRQLQHHDRRADQNQRRGRGRPPYGALAKTLPDRPSQADAHGQHRQDEVSEGVASAHQQGHEEDDAGQTTIDDLEQESIDRHSGGLPHGQFPIRAKGCCRQDRRGRRY